MKISKSLFLAFAGLGLFACSNEDVTENGSTYDGETTVNVKLNLPKLVSNASRSGSGMQAENGAESGTSEATTPLEVNSIRVVLNAANGVKEEKEISLTHMDGDDTQIGNITFAGVRSPESLQVFVNEKEEEGQIENIIADLTIDRINEAKLAAPLYGIARVTDSDISDGNGFSWVEETKQYNVVVTPNPRYARLELSKISHEKAHEIDCMFKEAKFKGVFLQNVATTENGATFAVANKWEDLTTSYASPTWSTVSEDEDNDFLKESNVWPAGENMCYAYSIFEGHDAEGNLVQPSVVFTLDQVKLSDSFVFPGWSDGGKLYAKVSKFKLNTPIQNADARAKYGIGEDGVTIEQFKAGNIYKITDIAIPDKAWGVTPEGGDDVTVTATVMILPWNIIDGTVEW